MTIGKRIKEVRKISKLTQTDFGKKVKVSGAAVSMIESGINEPSDQTISLICREFGIREEWLRTGDGSMKVEKPRDEILAAELDKVITAGSEDFRKRLIAWLIRMPPERWKALEEITLDLLRDVRNLSDTLDSAPLEQKNVHDWTDAEMHAELQRQLDAEKEETDEPSTSFSGSSGAATA